MIKTSWKFICLQDDVRPQSIKLNNVVMFVFLIYIKIISYPGRDPTPNHFFKMFVSVSIHEKIKDIYRYETLEFPYKS